MSVGTILVARTIYVKVDGLVARILSNTCILLRGFGRLRFLYVVESGDMFDMRIESSRFV